MERSSTERRQHRRYSVKENILLYNEITFAEILNISEGGLCCRFMAESRDQHVPCSIVDLLNTADKLYVQRLSCRDLNRHELTGSADPQALTIIRNCRIAFENLTDAQKDQLRAFIARAATDQS